MPGRQTYDPAHQIPSKVQAAWRDTLMARVTRTTRARNAPIDTIRTRTVGTFHTTPKFDDLLTQAARTRNIGRLAYVRRAVAAFIAADTSTPLPELLAEVAAPKPFDAPRTLPRKNGYVIPTRDNARGYGTWHVPPGQTQPPGPAETSTEPNEVDQ